MKTPLVSIIMSVYNAEPYLKEAMDSIINQTFKDYEFIIIEDCSTDNSLSILQEYEKNDSRIRIIRKSENKRMKGFIENLNIGLKEAKGKYIARMDADDISLPSRLEKQVDFLENNPNIFLVGSSVNFIDKNGDFLRKLDALEQDEEIKKQMPKKIALYHPVIMFRNDSKIRYRLKALYCEDYDLYLVLMNLNKNFYNFKEPLLSYRLLDSSISRKDGNFKRTLFVEKIKQFYYETKKMGQDSYDAFSPDEFLNIEELESPTSKSNLIFALKVATKFSYKNEFKLISKKYKLKYKNTSIISVLKVLNLLPNPFVKLYFKLNNIY